MRVLLTGGAGYIGTHIIVELHAAGHDAIVVDDLSNSNRSALDRVTAITGRPVSFHRQDVRDTDALRAVFAAEQPEAVIHLAGLKAVGESVEQPLRYYDTNLNSTFSLVRVMAETGVRRLIFSSSATVYGEPEALPLTENSRIGQGIISPYGWTKFMIEQILRDWVAADPRWQVAILRYFNPVGAHSSGLLGEDPEGIPNNLMPVVAQVATGKLDCLSVYGDDYDTPDGTCVRDYIHVMDLADGHLAALDHLAPGVSTYNLGTGQGTSVLELVAAYGQACGHPIPYRIAPRRPGDLPSTYCSAAKAETELGWRATRTLGQACADSWAWESGQGTAQG